MIYKKSKFKKILLQLSKLFIGSIFTYAGVIKISNISYFNNSIINYRILPAFFSPYIAVVIACIELLAGIFLLFNVCPKKTSYILLILLLVFMFLIIFNLIRGVYIDCGCFLKSLSNKSELKSNMWKVILRDLFLLIVVGNIINDERKLK